MESTSPTGPGLRNDTRGAARHPQHRFWRPAILVLGILISAAIAGVVHDMLGEEAAGQREVARQSLAAGLQSHVDRELGFVGFLRGLYDSSDTVTLAEFQRFARLNPDVRDRQWWISIAWALRQAQSPAAASPAAGPGAGAALPVAGFADDDAFPVTYLDPMPDSDAGAADAAADPRDRASMLLAAESLHLTIGPPRMMGSGAHRSMAIKAFLPVFKSDDGAAPARLQGFLVCTVMLDGFFDSFLGNAVTEPDLSVRVYDGETAIFTRGVWHGAVEPSALAFGDRNWRVEFSGQGQPIESELWLPLLVFVIGLALTALLYLRLLRADTEYLRIADEVRLATAELASANHRLAERSTALQQVADDFRRSSQEAQVANAAKTVFLANMSHELRTPLNAVIGFSEMIANQALGANSPRYIDYAKDIRSSGRYLLSIIEDLLDMSRIELGQMQLRFESASLADLVGEVVKFVALRARERGIDIRHFGMESLPQVEIDPKAMRQALINLLANAVKFSDPGSDVEIRGAIEDGGGIAISVIDHGSGIREQDLGRIFEPFWQSEAYRSKAKDGIGLGLAITQRLVAAHDATIEVNSQEGIGTTMVMHLPATRVLRGAPRLSVVGGTAGSAA